VGRWRIASLLNLITRYYTTNQRKKRFEVQLGELWTVDCGLLAKFFQSHKKLFQYIPYKVGHYGSQ
jgi:hypothetical protein